MASNEHPRNSTSIESFSATTYLFKPRRKLSTQYGFIDHRSSKFYLRSAHSKSRTLLLAQGDPLRFYMESGFSLRGRSFLTQNWIQQDEKAFHWIRKKLSKAWLQDSQPLSLKRIVPPLVLISKRQPVLFPLLPLDQLTHLIVADTDYNCFAEGRITQIADSFMWKDSPFLFSAMRNHHEGFQLTWRVKISNKRYEAFSVIFWFKGKRLKECWNLNNSTITKINPISRNIRKARIPKAPLDIQNSEKSKTFDFKKFKTFRVRSAGVTIAGRIWSSKPKTPFLILFHGSGPENSLSGSGFEGRCIERSPISFFEDIAKSQIGKEFTVVSFDKRGVGLSTGDFHKASRTDLVKDALQITKHIRKLAKTRRLYLAGFSEGASIALEVATKIKTIDGLVFACGSIRSLQDVVFEKSKSKFRKQGRSKQWIEQKLREQTDIFERIRSLGMKNRLNDLRGTYHGYSWTWWYEMLQPLPEEVINKVHFPVLIVHGGEDEEVLPKEAIYTFNKLCKLNKDTKYVILPRLNHFFSESFRTYPSLEYEIPEKPSKALIDTILGLLKA